AAFLPDLVRTVAVRAAVLTSLGRADEAFGAYDAAAVGLPETAVAQLLVARAATQPPGPQAWADVVQATQLIDRSRDWVAAAFARRQARASLYGSPLLAWQEPGRAAAPRWLTQPYPEGLVRLVNGWMGASEPAGMDASLTALLTAVSAPGGDAELDVLIALHADTPGVNAVPESLDEARRDGVKAVTTSRHEDEQRRADLATWLDTPTWAASRAFLQTRPRLLTDPQVLSALSSARADPVASIHLGIARLAEHLPIDDIYDIVTDTSDARDAALEAVEKADADLLRDLALAAPALLRQAFVGPFLALTLALLDRDTETAADLASVAAQQAVDGEIATGTARLQRLARRRPDLAPDVTRVLAVLRPPDQAAGRASDPAGQI
ncbi:MAG: hypothetical protein DLM59_20485, partial [Pseudonocardiales bacterium]